MIKNYIYIQKTLILTGILMLNSITSCKKDGIDDNLEIQKALNIIDTNDTIDEEDNAKDSYNELVETSKTGYCRIYKYQDKILRGVRVRFNRPKSGSTFWVKYNNIYGEEKTAGPSTTTITRTVKRYIDQSREIYAFRYKKRYISYGVSAESSLLGNIFDGNVGTWQKNWSVKAATNDLCKKAKEVGNLTYNLDL